MSNFSSVLSRADSSVLQDLIGSATLRLLQELSPTGLRTADLRTLLLNQCSEQHLLERRESRRAILDLLKPEEATALCGQLGLTVTSSPFTALQELRLNSTTLGHLLNFFGLEGSESASLEVKGDRCDVEPSYGLFDHQRQALSTLRRLLGRAAYHRAVLHMPTGAGKTRTAMNFVVDHLREHTATLVFWFATTEELCEQAEEEFAAAWRSMGDRSVTIHRVWGGRNFDAATARDGIVIASMATAYRRLIDTGLWAAQAGAKTSLIVMDEAHQAIAPTYQLVLDAFLARRSDMKLLGLTATPGRTWNDVFQDERLADYFNRQKVTLTVPGYSNPVEFLITEGYLARPTFVPIRVDTALTSDERTKLSQDLDVPESILERIAANELRSARIIREVIALAKRHQRILVFSTTAAHASLLASVLAAYGVAARSVTASTPPRQRAENIRWYKQPSEEPRVLVNFGVLTTGFDAPRTSAALIARPTKSLVLFSQMVGRATRGPRAGGNQEAEIVTVTDTSLHGFGNMCDAFTNWEDVW